MDEPTAGVDVELRKNLWENVKLLHSQGVTIILTTHYLEEAEEMCDRIGILSKGNLVALDSTKNLLNKIQTNFMDIAGKDYIQLQESVVSDFLIKNSEIFILFLKIDLSFTE